MPFAAGDGETAAFEDALIAVAAAIVRPNAAHTELVIVRTSAKVDDTRSRRRKRSAMSYGGTAPDSRRRVTSRADPESHRNGMRTGRNVTASSSPFRGRCD